MDVQYNRSTQTVVFGIRFHAYKATRDLRYPIHPRARTPASLIHTSANRPPGLLSALTLALECVVRAYDSHWLRRYSVLREFGPPQRRVRPRV